MNGNGNGLLSKLNAVPWMAILTIGGWVGLGLIFYERTTAQLDQQQNQLEEARRQRERIDNKTDALAKELNEFINRVDRLDTPLSRKVESNGQLLSVLNDRVNTSSATTTQRFEQLGDSMKQMQSREDRITQALDSLYSQMQVLSKSVVEMRKEH